MDSARRQELLAAKLRALVTSQWGPAPPGPDGETTGTFPGGATLRRGRTGWVLADQVPERALGGALAWAAQTGIDELHVLAEDASGILARRAAAFSRPPRVWRIQGRSLAAAAPDAPVSHAPIPPEVAAFVSVFEAAGVEPVVEQGMLLGEVRGLEVARVVAEADGARLEVGVGKHDRAVQRLLEGRRSREDALVAAAATVRELRHVDARTHQANRLAPERWLRSVVVADPSLIGATWLAPLSPPVARANLKQRSPAPAAGFGSEGVPMVAVCSTGIDVDLVPAAADARMTVLSLPGGAPTPPPGRGGDPNPARPGERAPKLVLVVPESDDHPLTRTLAAALVDPAEIVTVPQDWRRLPT